MIKYSKVDVDQVAEQIAHAARMARSMPQIYMAHGHTYPILGTGGEQIGQALPGKGVYLNSDLKELGITKRIPGVYERSPFGRLWDVIQDDRASITTFDSIINGRAQGNAEDILVTKSSFTTVANAWSTVFRAGGMPVAGTYTNAPVGAANDRSSTGALSQGLSSPSAGTKKYLLTFGAVSSSQINWLMLTDLLVNAGNISAATTSANSVLSTALTRYTTGAGVLMTFDVTTALGATAQNMTVSYTNQAGTAGQSTGAVVVTPSAIAQRLLPIATGPWAPLASGDTGVRAVSSVTFSAANTAGVVALNLYKPISWIPGFAANVYVETQSTNQLDGLTELVQTSGNVIGCLNVYILPNTTSSGLLTMSMRTVSG